MHLCPFCNRRTINLLDDDADDDDDVKFPPTVKIFGTKMAKRINLCEVH